MKPVLECQYALRLNRQLIDQVWDQLKNKIRIQLWRQLSNQLGNRLWNHLSNQFRGSNEGNHSW